MDNPETFYRESGFVYEFEGYKPPVFDLVVKVRIKRGVLILDRWHEVDEVIEVIEPHGTHLVKSGAAEFVVETAT